MSRIKSNAVPFAFQSNFKTLNFNARLDIVLYVDKQTIRLDIILYVDSASKQTL